MLRLMPEEPANGAAGESEEGADAHINCLNRILILTTNLINTIFRKKPRYWH